MRRLATELWRSVWPLTMRVCSMCWMIGGLVFAPEGGNEGNDEGEDFQAPGNHENELM